MSVRQLTALALVPIFLVGCEPPEEQPAPGVPDDDRPVEQDWDRDDDYDIGHEETIGIDEIRDSGISGEARFTVTGPNETQVMLEIDNAPANAAFTGRIERGTCDDLERAHTPGQQPGQQQPGQQQPGQQPPPGQDVPGQEREQVPGDRQLGMDELEELRTDADGHGISTTVLDMRFEQFERHAVLVEDQQGQLVACGDVDTWGMW